MGGLKQWKSIRSTLDGRSKTVENYQEYFRWEELKQWKSITSILDGRPKTVEKYQVYFRLEA